MTLETFQFEILRDLDENYKFELLNNYGSNENYLKATTKIFEDLQENLIDLQEELINAVTYIYNLNNDSNLEKYTYSERFAVYLIKRKGKLYSYYKNDLIMRDSYSRKYDEFLNKIQNKNVVLLEIGVGFNTPGIIRFPFEQMTANNLRTTLIRINKDYPSPMLEIENKTISFDEDTNKIIEDLKE